MTGRAWRYSRSPSGRGRGASRLPEAPACARRPVERRLDLVFLLIAPRPARIALHDVAFAPRIMRKVDREAELRRIAGLLRALVIVVDEIIVTAHVKLEDLVGLGRALGDFLQR